MSQHDQNIANDTGAAVRGDINNALAALFSLSSGASAPSTTTAYMWWADTTNNLLKQRNAANTGWLVRGTLAETFVLARSSNTILGVGDHGRVIVATSTFTQTLTAAATLGDGWHVGYRNDGSGVITIDPNASETIDGGTTITLQPGESCVIHCNGSAFKTIGRRRINDLTEDTSPVPADDYVETWDASAGGHKKVKISNLPQGLAPLASGSVTSAASMPVDMTSYTAYKHKRIVFMMRPATDVVGLVLRTSTNGGSSYDAGATDYGYSATVQYDDGGAAARFGNQTSSIGISGAVDVGNAAAEGIAGYVDLYHTTDATLWTKVAGKSVWQNSGAAQRAAGSDFLGSRRAAADVDAVQFLFSSGNVAAGEWLLYGWN